MNQLNVILFYISHSNGKNYVATQFSPFQGGKNQMVGSVFFFTLDLGGHLIPFTLKQKIKYNKIIK